MMPKKEEKEETIKDIQIKTTMPLIDPKDIKLNLSKLNAESGVYESEYSNNTF